MINEDKKLIAEYMGWKLDGSFYYDPNDRAVIVFDPTDASLCVQEMQKRGEYNDFYWRTVQDNDCADFSAWLFNADNFFKAFMEWRKGK